MASISALLAGLSAVNESAFSTVPFTSAGFVGSVTALVSVGATSVEAFSTVVTPFSTVEFLVSTGFEEVSSGAWDLVATSSTLVSETKSASASLIALANSGDNLSSGGSCVRLVSASSAGSVSAACTMLAPKILAPTITEAAPIANFRML